MSATHLTDCCKKAEKMILYGDALSLIEKSGQQNSGRVEEIDLISARGRILAQDVLSPEAVPSFDNSAMDGFAVFTQDLETAGPQSPVVLPVVHRVAAGDLTALELASRLGPGRAIEIMTGAPLPRNGCDAVVRFEDTHRLSNRGAVEFRSPAKRGANIRLAGSDIEKGRVLARAGKRLGPEQILALAAVGWARVVVKRRPKIAILSTGAELVPFTQKELPLGLIRNSTAPFLIAALEAMGFRADTLGIQEDNAKAYRQSIEKALGEGADLILSTGAVSMGKVDFVPEVLSDLKAKVQFHKAAIRPGKPILFAELAGHQGDRLGVSPGCAFFGMPGNPISTVIALRFFVEPYLRSFLGLSSEKAKSAKLLNPVTKPKGLRSFLKGHVTRAENGELRVQVLKEQASYMVAALGESNSWVVIDEDRDSLSAGESVVVVLLPNGLGDWI